MLTDSDIIDFDECVKANNFSDPDYTKELKNVSEAKYKDIFNKILFERISRVKKVEDKFRSIEQILLPDNPCSNAVQYPCDKKFKYLYFRNTFKINNRLYYSLADTSYNYLQYLCTGIKRGKPITPLSPVWCSIRKNKPVYISNNMRIISPVPDIGNYILIRQTQKIKNKEFYEDYTRNLLTGKKEKLMLPCSNLAKLNKRQSIAKCSNNILIYDHVLNKLYEMNILPEYYKFDLLNYSSIFYGKYTKIKNNNIIRKPGFRFNKIFSSKKRNIIFFISNYYKHRYKDKSIKRKFRPILVILEYNSEKKNFKIYKKFFPENIKYVDDIIAGDPEPFEFPNHDKN
jgi:hypothetical protein